MEEQCALYTPSPRQVSYKKATEKSSSEGRGAEEAEGVWPVSRGIRAIVDSRRANIAMCAFGVPATTVYLSAPW